MRARRLPSCLQRCAASTAGSNLNLQGSVTIGQLGNNNSVASSSVPTPVLGGFFFNQLDTINCHTCGITTTGGAVVCWGAVTACGGKWGGGAAWPGAGRAVGLAIGKPAQHCA